VEFPQLKSFLSVESSPFCIPPSSSVLMVGCGNSKLSDQMFNAGYVDMLSIDISPTVVERMRD
jgi:2-polyprenyl-3-methyl-5-hydroxy-6-metoxy-1,4-benzoquinol methylase